MNRQIASELPQTPRLSDAPLAEQIEQVEARVRAQPTTAAHRWALFQLLCITGEWSRAIQQLQTWARLDPDQTHTAQVFRDLIRAERWRAKVMCGQERPGFVLEPALWVKELIGALRLSADGQSQLADEARKKALDAAPLTAVRTPQGVAGWIADSDSRFGPVCEIVTAGHYRWMPFSDLAAWRMSRPTNLIDLVWAPCVLTLNDDSIVRGFMPARYPGSDTATDALRLGRETVWHESGRTGVIALGQKTWTTEQGDFGLFDFALFGPPDTAFGTPEKWVAEHGNATGEPADD
ncbi:type VI secretion system accessory protein TagJ [Burkholderia sp. BCC1988]|uniref:type VI secretion system accessory protein TagJ n=1 Tax=Burkholderia sp. BCC1988 TaxID=2817443 RepID=UPI002AB2F6BC|nr:type VI secretion system accessory protein TagJ [Burkholderia sp. BCC1988]